MKKLVIVGCGKLGNIVVDALLKGLLSEYALVGACSRTREKAEALAARVDGCQVCDSVEELLALKPDFVVDLSAEQEKTWYELDETNDAAQQRLLELVDVLVDGPFVESLKDISLRFRGSSNQRIIRLK